jgi:hypothetical protein
MSDNQGTASDFKQILENIKNPEIKADMKAEIKQAEKEGLEQTSIDDPEVEKTIEYVSRNGKIYKKITTYEPIGKEK